MSDSLWPHGLQHARLPCPSLSPRVCSNSSPLSRSCYPAISASLLNSSKISVITLWGIWKTKENKFLACQPLIQSTFYFCVFSFRSMLNTYASYFYIHRYGFIQKILLDSSYGCGLPLALQNQGKPSIWPWLAHKLVQETDIYTNHCNAGR